jgi:hypothetical protein
MIPKSVLASFGPEIDHIRIIPKENHSAVGDLVRQWQKISWPQYFCPIFVFCGPGSGLRPCYTVDEYKTVRQERQLINEFQDVEEDVLDSALRRQGIGTVTLWRVCHPAIIFARFFWSWGESVVVIPSSGQPCVFYLRPVNAPTLAT